MVPYLSNEAIIPQLKGALLGMHAGRRGIADSSDLAGGLVPKKKTTRAVGGHSRETSLGF